MNLLLESEAQDGMEGPVKCCVLGTTPSDMTQRVGLGPTNLCPSSLISLPTSKAALLQTG